MLTNVLLQALLPLLVASALASDLIAAGVEPLPQYTQEQNTATGEYGYSYSGGPSAKTEFRALDGTTTGTYSYVDANGILQTVSYIADEFGFRAAGSNIPTEGAVPLDAPDVAVAKAAHLAEHSRQTLEALNQHRRKRSLVAEPALALAPIAHAALPLATSSQSRFQIHNRGLIAQSTIIAQPLGHSLLFRKKRGILAAPLAVAAPLPPSSAKILSELPRAGVLAAAPLAAAPVAAALPVAAPLPVATTIEHLPLATSSQSRFQIHNRAKIVTEVHQPIFAAPAPILAEPALLPAALPAKPAFLPSFAGIAGAALPATEAIVNDSDVITVESA